jgi:class 3 adenylate cyclase/tetratricopeptide (TPR) repeat protein
MIVEINHWLEALGLGQYSETFAARNIDFDMLPQLGEAELERLGLSLEHRKRLRQALDTLQDPAAATPIRDESAQQRQVTVMFCDIVGSTEMSARLDLEDQRATLRAYQSVCAAAIGLFDGFIAQYQGDGVLAYFGYPSAHEDEAARAVRAGLAILASLDRGAPDAKIALRVRIGIATGPVLVGRIIGRGEATHVAVTGKIPNIAARIQQLARPGTLVISDCTRRLAATQFECRPMDARRLKGINEAIPLWQVLRELSEAERFDRRPTRVDCVGRERELGLLLDRWKSATSGSGQAVVVTGEAGIGKSRLVERFHDDLPSGARIDIRLDCAQRYRNTPFHPFIVHLERAAGFASGDTPAAKVAKIAQWLAAAGRSDGTPLLSRLLSLTSGSSGFTPLMSPKRQRAEIQELLIDYVLRVAARQPVLLVVEDVHWVDPTSEATLIQLLDRLDGSRVLVLLTVRPDHASRVVDHPRGAQLMLGPLGASEAERMIATLAAGIRLPEEVVKRILIKTDGVPLFIEQLTKSILESGQLRLEDGAYCLNGSLPPLAIPVTLADTLRARLDRLPSVIDVAQVGASLGRSFSYAVLAAVMNADTDRLRSALEQLVGANLVYQDGAPPDAVYSFKHALVQDAAYESLLRSQRVALHARIVAVMESRFPDMVETEPELLAYHSSRAELDAKAARYWLKAGARAVSRSPHLEAINHLRHGLEKLDAVSSPQERTRLELELQLMLGQALIAVRGYTAEETRLAFSRAEQLAGQIGDAQQRYSALYGIFTNLLIGGRIDVAAETVGRMHQLASHGGDDAYLCLAYRLRGSLSFFRGNIAQAHDDLQQAVVLHSPARQRQLAHYFGPDTGLATQIFLAMTEFLGGRPETAWRTAETAIANARRLEKALTLAQVLSLAAQIKYMAQDIEGLIRIGKEASDHCDRFGILYFGMIAHLHHIWGEARRSNAVADIEAFRRRLADFAAMRCGLQLGLFHCMLGQLLLAAGAPAEATREVETALAMTAANGERWWAPEMHRTHGNALLASSDAKAPEAEACFRRAIAEARRRGTPMLELRAATSLAHLLISLGRDGEAQRALLPVVAQLSEALDGPELCAARALLPGMPPLDLTLTKP